MLYRVVERDGSFVLEQQDGRCASGWRELATGSQEQMELLKKHEERRRKAIFRIDQEADDRIEAIKKARKKWDKQFQFDEAVQLWLAFSQDLETLDRIRSAFGAADRPWQEGLFAMVRGWLEEEAERQLKKALNESF